MSRVRTRRVIVPLLVVGVIAACATAETSDTAAGALGPVLRTSADTIAFGRQVVISHGCGDCHGGGDNPGAPGWLDGMRDTVLQQFVFMGMKTRPRNLTPDNETGLGRFSERQIFNALRFGLRPGETPDAEITSSTPGQGNFPMTPKYLAPPMPWPAFRHMSDVELWSIAAYLKRAVQPSSHKVEDSDGPPDFWASLYGQFAAVYPAPTFPTANEQTPPQ